MTLEVTWHAALVIAALIVIFGPLSLVVFGDEMRVGVDKCALWLERRRVKKLEDRLREKTEEVEGASCESP